MREGLCPLTLKYLISNLRILDQIGNRDQLLRNEIFLTLNQAFSKSDLIKDIRKNLLMSTEKKNEF